MTETNGWAGSGSCRECHQKFYTLWSTSFHGLAMQPYTARAGQNEPDPQTNDIVAGKYRFRADLEKRVVIERMALMAITVIRWSQAWVAKMCSIF